jgi:hypothetical protein
MSDGDERVPSPPSKEERQSVEAKAKIWRELLDAEKALQALNDLSDEKLKATFTNSREELAKPLEERIAVLRKEVGLT